MKIYLEKLRISKGHADKGGSAASCFFVFFPNCCPVEKWLKKTLTDEKILRSNEKNLPRKAHFQNVNVAYNLIKEYLNGYQLFRNADPCAVSGVSNRQGHQGCALVAGSTSAQGLPGSVEPVLEAAGP